MLAPRSQSVMLSVLGGIKSLQKFNTNRAQSLLNDSDGARNTGVNNHIVPVGRAVRPSHEMKYYRYLWVHDEAG